MEILLYFYRKCKKNEIIVNDGSIQNLSTIPLHIQSLYKTVWEINQRHIINMSSDRTKYICQSQSLNIFLDDSSPTKVSNMLMYGWKSGLKTGMYYLRTKSAVNAIQFTLSNENKKKVTEEEPLTADELKNMILKAKDNPDDCLMCGS